MGVLVINRDKIVDLVMTKGPSYVGENLEVQEVQPDEIVQEDTIEKARKDLERINSELDAKEQDLLKQRESIDAELERLRETRVSFQ